MNIITYIVLAERPLLHDIFPFHCNFYILRRIIPLYNTAHLLRKYHFRHFFISILISLF